MITIKDISYVRGDTYALTITIQGLKESDTITGLYFTVKNSSDDTTPVIEKSLGNGIEPMETENQFNILVEAGDSKELEVGCPYYYDIKVVVGSIEKTPAKGTFTLQPNYTSINN